MKRVITCLLVMASLYAYAQGDRFECNDSCSVNTTGEATFNVVSPTGFSTVEPIEMAPRLTTLIYHGDDTDDVEGGYCIPYYR